TAIGINSDRDKQRSGAIFRVSPSERWLETGLDLGRLLNLAYLKQIRDFPMLLQTIEPQTQDCKFQRAMPS
ncbi:MAG: hypothetical protein P1U77_19440, partial [Rubripirellula sp.]|nr:hypothetical protein [Rubripirellula sp.]